MYKIAYIYVCIRTQTYILYTLYTHTVRRTLRVILNTMLIIDSAASFDSSTF